MCKLWFFSVVVSVAIICSILKKYETEAVAVLFKKSYPCPNLPNPAPLTIDVKLKKTLPNKTQLIEFNMEVPFPVHTNTLATVRVEYNALGRAWTPLIKLDHGKGMCDLFSSRGGELWSNIRKAVGLTGKPCPLPVGKYHGDNIPIYLTKLKVASVPPGNYRATIEARNKSNNAIILCEMFDVEDKS